MLCNMIKICIRFCWIYGLWIKAGGLKSIGLNHICLFFCVVFWNDCDEILGGKIGQLLKSYDHRGNNIRQFQIKISKDYFLIYEYVPSIALLSK